MNNLNQDPGLSEFSVDPINGLGINGEYLIQRDKPTIRNVHLELDRPYFIADNQLARALAEIINNPQKFLEEFQPLSSQQQDFSEKGIRTIKGVLKSHPNCIIVLSGLGIVKFFETNEFTIEPPHWDENVDMFFNGIGNTQISEKGLIYSCLDQTVFGAYNLPELESKINNTNIYSPSINQDYNIEILLAGKHKEHNQHGWMVYSMPINSVRVIELQRFDIQNSGNDQESMLFNQYMYKLFNKIKLMHQNEIIHLELHPGNCYPVIEKDGSIDLVVTDWETAQSLEFLPSDNKLKLDGYSANAKIWEGSPKKIARAVDLYFAFNNALLVSNNQLGYLPEYNYFNNHMINLQLDYYSNAIAGYLGININVNNVREIIDKVFYEIVIEDTKNSNESIKLDWNQNTGDFKSMERPDLLIKTAFDILSRRVAGFLASDHKELTFEFFENQRK